MPRVEKRWRNNRRRKELKLEEGEVNNRKWKTRIDLITSKRQRQRRLRHIAGLNANKKTSESRAGYFFFLVV